MTKTTFKRTETPYGLTISDFEWQMDLRVTTRQDGNTSIAMILTDIDGVVRVAGPQLIPTTQKSLDITVERMTRELCTAWGVSDQMIIDIASEMKRSLEAYVGGDE